MKKGNKDLKLQTEGFATLYEGNCFKLLPWLKKNGSQVNLIITSPPYCMGKEYEDPKDNINTFKRRNKKAIKECIDLLKEGGSLCWQVGYHVSKDVVIPLDFLIFQIVEEINKQLPVSERLILRNRIIWTFGHGLNATKRLSGRHETILWFTKGNSDYKFDLDSIRIPQKYPGKRYSKGPHKGEVSSNIAGKNPTDVWDIPNVKANHVEKTEHPCQFPEALPARLIKALTNENDVVLDPFMGSGTTAVACGLNNRKFIGSELDKKYFDIALERIKETESGKIRIRPDVPVEEPDPRWKVSQKPKSELIIIEKGSGIF